MGGTFDPLHFGHLFIAEAARDACELDEVIFFPNNLPAHAQGKSTSADAELRYELMLLGIEDNSHFRGSRIELERPGKSYAFDTIQQFQRELGADVELYFIIGADSMRDLLTWYRGAELFDLCCFVAATRPGFDSAAAIAALSDEQRARVISLEVPGLYISSTELRLRVRQQKTIRYLTPEPVRKRIEEINLYHQVEQKARPKIGAREF